MPPQPPYPAMPFALPAGGRQLRTMIKLRCGASTQRPAPKLGQALGPLGINMMQFCKRYNELTQHLKDGVQTPLKLYVYKNKTFELQIHYPSASEFLKKAAGVSKGAARPRMERAGAVSLRQIYEIARVKQCDPGQELVPLRSICRSLVGSARSMGLEVVE